MQKKQTKKQQQQKKQTKKTHQKQNEQTLTCSIEWHYLII